MISCLLKGESLYCKNNMLSYKDLPVKRDYLSELKIAM